MNDIFLPSRPITCIVNSVVFLFLSPSYFLILDCAPFLMYHEYTLLYRLRTCLNIYDKDSYRKCILSMHLSPLQLCNSDFYRFLLFNPMNIAWTHLCMYFCYMTYRGLDVLTILYFGCCCSLWNNKCRLLESHWHNNSIRIR